jgi:hypothetical protein
MTPASNLTKVPLRTLFAWALLGYVALDLFFEFVDWLLPEGGSSLVDRSAGADFVTLTKVGLPMVALLLATQVAPPLRESKLMALIALAEYGAIVLFGLITFLLGLGAMNGVDASDLLGYLVLSLAGLAIAALAGLYAFRIWSGVSAPTG